MYPRVLILMSTYNGELFVKSQLCSIVGQSYPDIDILIRDDGSIDSTVSIIQNSNIKNLTLIKGKNIGVPNAYFELIRIAPDNYDFYAFADQDDIWLPDKIAYSIEIMAKRNQLLPLVYSSDVLRITKNLAVVHKMKRRIHHLLLENPASGCTIVFNRKTKIEVTDYMPEHAIMHDFWIFWIGVFLGEWIYDSRKTMLYRYHENNVTVGKKTFMINDVYASRLEMANEFFNNYGHRLDEGGKKMFINLLMKNNLIQRIQKVLSCKYAFNSPIASLLLKLEILKTQKNK